MSAGQYIRRAAGYFIKLVVLVGLLGYVSREAEADIVADRDAIINAFHAAGYVMAGEVPGELMTFRAGSFLRRLWLTFDDRVTVRTFGGGIVIEGIRKEAVHAQFRINTYIQNRSYGKRD